MKAAAVLSVILFVAMSGTRGYAQATFEIRYGGGNWTNPAIWTVTAGSDADGVPDADDTVHLYPTNWPSGYTMTIDQAGWACSTLYIHSIDGNDHPINITSNGTIHSCIWSNNVPQYGFVMNYYPGGPSLALRMTEWHDIGPRRARFLYGGWVNWVSWEGDVKITYHTTNDNTFTTFMAFTNASSVYLAASRANSVTNREQISNVGGGQSTAVLMIGRSDDGVQNWTVGSGCHPVYLARQTGHGYCISKAGLGDVNMADVDLVLDLSTGEGNWGANPRGSISGDANGDNPGANTSPYSGTVRVNSYKIIASQKNGPLVPKHCYIAGNFVIDGQAGLSGGGTGNGLALEVVSTVTNTTTYVRVCTPASAGSVISAANRPHNGRLEVTSAGGSICLTNFTDSGEIQLNIASYATEKSNAVVVANIIDLACTNATISDRNIERPDYVCSSPGWCVVTGAV